MHDRTAASKAFAIGTVILFLYRKKMKKIILFYLIILLGSLNFVLAQSQSNQDNNFCPLLNVNMRISANDKKAKGEVTKLQVFMKKYFELPDSKFLVTGNFGNVTKNVVKRFQEENELIVTGIVGAVTRNTIRKICLNNSSIMPEMNIPIPSIGSSSTNTVPISTSNINVNSSTNLQQQTEVLPLMQSIQNNINPTNQNNQSNSPVSSGINCSLNSQAIEDGGFIWVFGPKNNAGICQQEMRICRSGVLSGTLSSTICN